ncbi:MAG: TonB-dependent receptor [Bacteroidota bacterium]|nr:TonB-dependent receptor [Bacteroidota bacterium]
MNSVSTSFYCPKYLSIAVLILMPFIGLHAQSKVIGMVRDSKDQPVSYANVLLLSPQDSSLIRGGVAGDNGSFEISNILPGEYLMKVAMTGLAENISEKFTFSGEGTTKDFGSIVLEEDAVLMNAVEVIAKKPLYEQKIDRMVVNVANSITSSGINALEVLERSPGVMVNRQSNTLTLSGKSGVVVMINGRINYMPADAVVSMLEGMSADNIEKIEIINTPPAGFDAEGNAGYINIILKKNLDEGFNGAFGGSVGFGKGIQTSANTNFNYRKGKMNLYGDYSYTKEAQEQIFAFYRRILLNGDIVETDTRSVRDPDTDNHNARVGLDLQVSDKTVVGILASAYDTKWTMDANNTSLISRNYVLDTTISISNYELNQWKHAGGNINLQHTFSEGRRLTMDVDMLWYKDNNPTTYKNENRDGEGNFLLENYTRASK